MRQHQISLKRLVQNECANAYQENHKTYCYQTPLMYNNAYISTAKRDKCAVVYDDADNREVCPYFERCLVPMADKYYPECADAVDEYFSSWVGGRPVKKCACGKPRRKNHKYCEECRRRNQQIVERKKKHKYRIKHDCVHPSTAQTSCSTGKI